MKKWSLCDRYIAGGYAYGWVWICENTRISSRLREIGRTERLQKYFEAIFQHTHSIRIQLLKKITTPNLFIKRNA